MLSIVSGGDGGLVFILALFVKTACKKNSVCIFNLMLMLPSTEWHGCLINSSHQIVFKILTMMEEM